MVLPSRYLKGNFTHVEFDWPHEDCEADLVNGRRFYETPHGMFPSVTTVLSHRPKEGIKEWVDRVGVDEAERIKRIASERGTRVHDLCETYIKNESINVREVNAFDLLSLKTLIPLMEKHIDNVRMTEVCLYSKFLGVAGRVDLIAEWDGVLSVIDWKTSLREKKKEWIDDYFRQESAYCVCFEEMTGVPIKRMVTVISNDADPPQYFVEDRDRWIHSFISLKDQFYREVEIPDSF